VAAIRSCNTPSRRGHFVIWKYATRKKFFLVSQSSHPHFGGSDTWHRTLFREAVNLSSDNHLQTPERATATSRPLKSPREVLTSLWLILGTFSPVDLRRYQNRLMHLRAGLNPILNLEAKAGRSISAPLACIGKSVWFEGLAHAAATSCETG
jgi:hypothetical protein